LRTPKEIKGVFAAGVTGGHIYPALAVAKEIEKMRPLQALFIGTGRGAEKDIYNDEFPFEHLTLKSSGSDRSRLYYVYHNSKALIKAFFILKKFHPHFVFTTGGYIGGIASYAAHLLKIPIFLHESNVEVGIANKKLTSYASISFCTFEQSKKSLKNPFVSGTPVREEFFFPKDEDFKEKFGSKTVLIFGGSEGSDFLDKITKSLSSKLEDVVFIHTGKSVVKTHNVKHFDYIHDMAYFMRNVDAVVCRAGASTLAEIMASKVPAILVPWKGALNSHQMKNAKYLQSLSAAVVVDEDETNDAKMKELLEMLLDPKTNENYRNKLRTISPKNSPAKIIAEKILEKLEIQN
jgi:UDP-N-acetylglucosamine--N-acetylmuramyl-(pentapeptide) pyrophosphoryl-undecaprenol N-acetylglucosamine transferase